jgi:hypothetical protein
MRKMSISTPISPENREKCNPGGHSPHHPTDPPGEKIFFCFQKISTTIVEKMNVQP